MFVGTFDQEKNREEVIDDLESFINQRSISELHGSEKVKTVAVVTGGGVIREILDQVVEREIDMYITGEIKEEVPHYAKETNLNYVCGGHYATETCGIKALLKKIETEFGLETEFIDLPVDY